MFKSIFLFIDVIFNIIICVLSINFFVGDIVELDCVFDGNLLLNYIWIFNFIEVVIGMKYSLFGNNFKLFFKMNFIDNGYY